MDQTGQNSNNNNKSELDDKNRLSDFDLYVMNQPGNFDQSAFYTDSPTAVAATLYNDNDLYQFDFPASPQNIDSHLPFTAINDPSQNTGHLPACPAAADDPTRNPFTTAGPSSTRRSARSVQGASTTISPRAASGCNMPPGRQPYGAVPPRTQRSPAGRAMPPRPPPTPTGATLPLPLPSATGQTFPGPARASSGSPAFLGAPPGAPSVSGSTQQQQGQAGAGSFVRPAHHTLNHSRIERPGHDEHPDANWRAPGPHQWTEIVHDHTILRYCSTGAIKEIEKHCEKVIKANPDRAPPGGSGGAPRPAAVDGPYDTSDARAVWKYCEAYLKRRHQLANNLAASRSRAGKAAALKHWRALALAAGFPDRPFECDLGDPGNAPGAAPTLLAGHTQAAIDRWRREHAPPAVPAGGDTQALAAAAVAAAAAAAAAVPSPGGFGGGNGGGDDDDTCKYEPGKNAQPNQNHHQQQQQQQQQQHHHHHYAEPQPPTPAPAGRVPLPRQTRAQTRANARRPIRAPTPSAPPPAVAEPAPAFFDPLTMPGPSSYDDLAALLALPASYEPYPPAAPGLDPAWTGGWAQQPQGGAYLAGDGAGEQTRLAYNNDDPDAVNGATGRGSVGDIKGDIFQG